MKVIVIADDERTARYVRENHETLADAIKDALFWPKPLQDVEVVAQLRAPNRQELLSLLAAMGAEPTPEEQLEWEYAGLDDLARRPGSGVYRG